MTMRARVTSSVPPTASVAYRKEFGPISMTFEIPMFNISNLQVGRVDFRATTDSANGLENMSLVQCNAQRLRPVAVPYWPFRAENLRQTTCVGLWYPA